MEKDIYREQKTDMVKLVLRMKAKMWIPIVALLLGAGIFAGVYVVQYRIANGPMYSAVSKVYLDFAADETGEAYQYYNGYTWNDLMSTDPIMGKTMEGLNGISRSVAEQSTKAEILSDIRLLTVTISNEDQAVCAQIQEATEKSLEALGDSAKEFRDITVVKSVKPERVMADKRVKQAALLGAVLSFMVSFIWLLLYYVLDDRIFVPSDILGNLEVPFLGIEASAADGAGAQADKNDRYAKCLERFRGDLKSNTEFFCEIHAGSDNPSQTAADASGSGRQDPVRLDVCSLLSEGISVDYKALRKAPAVVLQARFGKVSLRALYYMLEQLALQQCGSVGVVITEADPVWICRYFGLSPKRGDGGDRSDSARPEARRAEE